MVSVGGGEVAKSCDPSRLSCALATAHSVSASVPPLRFGGFLAGGESQGGQWHLLSQVPLWMAVFLVVLHWVLETI